MAISGLNAEASAVTQSDLATAGGLVLIKSQSFSAASTVNVDSVFGGSYDNYRLLLRMIGSTSSIPTLRLRLAGTDASGANYEYQYLQASAATVSAARTTGATSLEIASVGSTDYSLVTMDIASPAAAATTQFAVTSLQFTTAIVNGSYAGRHTLTTAYDGFSLISSTGTITGTLRVYGYKNS